jgi:hypothetical protein
MPAASTSASPSAKAAVAVTIPAKEDFEVDTKRAITAANLDDKLDELEKQINATK